MARAGEARPGHPAKKCELSIFGRPMEVWQKHMSPGMYLCSACDWHLDPGGVSTIERFLEQCGQTPADVEPLSLQFYLEYTQWFQEQQRIAALPLYVERLDQIDSDIYRYEATLRMAARSGRATS